MNPKPTKTLPPDDNKIVIDLPKPKRRQGVMPTRRERDKSKDIPRKEKHKATPEAF
jgi:hypothetical protein